MIRHLLKSLLPLCVLLLGLPVQAEVLVLKSGAMVEGTILFRNDEAVVIRDASGARFQYLMSDVESILAEMPVKEDAAEVQAEEKKKKVSVVLTAGGGATFLVGHASGGAMHADLMIGSADLFGRRIFLGGAFGYRGMFFAEDNTIGLNKSYTFLPIQVRGEIPLTQTKHAPLLGVGVGYGIGVDKKVKGGLFVAGQLAWRCELKNRRAFTLGVYSEVQNASLSVTEIIDGKAYTDSNTRTFATVGAKVGIWL